MVTLAVLHRPCEQEECEGIVVARSQIYRVSQEKRASIGKAYNSHIQWLYLCQILP